MTSLRQRLQSESPDLHAALLRSWEIAQREWLPATTPSEGSYNSLPHFTNIERHLDALLGPAVESPNTRLQLTSLEVYLLLAGVLLHDLGRVHGDAEHARASADDLREHFAALGIPSFELASSLARIAYFHDPKRKGDDQAVEHAKRTLRDIRLEPYGFARELYVGTLLTLADHMDGSHRRALPRYVASDGMVGFKGAFRRLVSGTGYDPATCTLKTCLSGFPEAEDGVVGALELKKTYQAFDCAKRCDCNGGPWKPVDESQLIHVSPEKTCELYRDLMRVCCPRLTFMNTPSKMFDSYLYNKHGNNAFLLRRGFTIDGATGQSTSKRGPWPPDYLLAVVLNDLAENRRCLKGLRNDLFEMGLPVDDWFVEFDSEVYDPVGKLVLEPVLSRGFLYEVANEAWEFSLRLIGHRPRNYEVLADSLRTENVALVSLAMQRIVKRLRRLQPKEQSLFAGTSGWHWAADGQSLSKPSWLNSESRVFNLNS